VIFWQVSTAGAPDVWMAFFVTTGVLLVARARQLTGSQSRFSPHSGRRPGRRKVQPLPFLPPPWCWHFLWKHAHFDASALFSALRLVVVSGPTRATRFEATIPYFLLAPLRLDRPKSTPLPGFGARGHWRKRATFHPRALLFPFFAAVDQRDAGFWQFFGPLPFAFLCSSVLAWRNTPLWRTEVWSGCQQLVGLCSSGMLRFSCLFFGCSAAA